jgi:hypothetical protein
MKRRLKGDPAQPFFDLMPPQMADLTKGEGPELVRRLGVETIREITRSILCGGNLRDSTESLTRKRIALTNAATLVTFIRGRKADSHFTERLAKIACDGLGVKREKWERWALLWILGLNDKAVQNVIRDDDNFLKEYATQYALSQKDAATMCGKEYGDLCGSIGLGSNEKTSLDWNFVLQLLATVGAQTLTIRGSEKSTYGKLFEKLVLGSLLHILGFRHIDKKDIASNADVSNCFWLSSRKDKRESDATLLIERGHGVRFDIGFIGRGNPEISLDKVSRFEREAEFGKTKWYMATIIIVDTIGEGSRIQELARKIDGVIIQMSMGTWPQLVAKELARKVGYKSNLCNMKRAELEAYISAKMKDISPEHFIGDAIA